ncbi:MAG TPA: LuxR C-terminal-related transcriptional regulator [Nitrospiraceae bacterium]|nr:LuxR C-terminal-related transcriptional regulator [Nitrospiraceae bacterium]
MSTSLGIRQGVRQCWKPFLISLLRKEFKTKEIGQRLKISVKTVEAHRANMMQKIRVSNTAQLLNTAIQDGTIKIR